MKYASKYLFKNAVVVLTPTKKTDKKSLDIVKKLWEKMKAKVKIMPPARHDKILAMTSHLPHAVAFALVNSADNFEFAGNGFKDTTRIASSDPEMWADIIFNNRTNVRAAIRKFKKELSKIENAKSKKELSNIFEKAKIKRDRFYKGPKVKKLTEKGLLKFIKVSITRRRIPPTVREVAKYFNISVSTAHQHLKNLYKKGIISKRTTQQNKRIVARGINTNKS